MKSLILLVCASFITGCSFQHTKSLDERMGMCKEGYVMALRSGIRDLTEDVIFQIIMKKMNGFLEDTEQFEAELSQLVLEGKDESTRKKAELALYFLNSTSNFNIALIKSEYHDESKLYYLLEENLGPQTPDYTQLKK